MSAEALRQKIQRIVADELGSAMVDRDGDVVIRHDSAVVFVTVIEQENRNIVKLWATLALGVPPTPALYEWVATEGQDYFFARTKVSSKDDDGTVRVGWEYDLLGDYLDPMELVNAIHVVVGISNDLDDEIVSKFGGRRWTDPN